MSLQSVQGPSSFLEIGSLKSASGSGASQGASKSDLPFADLVRGLVQETNSQQVAANDSVRQLISGETDSIHDVVLTASRADLAFRLMMEIRNRLIASYQEVMRMQV